MTIVEEILRKPTARLLVEEAVRVLNEETVKRSTFRNWIDETTKAEFINGEVVMHSPAKNKHLNVTMLLSRIMSVYASHKKLGVVRIEKAMVALTRNDYERYAAAARYMFF